MSGALKDHKPRIRDLLLHDFSHVQRCIRILIAEDQKRGGLHILQVSLKILISTLTKVARMVSGSAR